MFHGATAFNQPLNFDTRNVTRFRGMLAGATAFNQPLNFDLGSVVNNVQMQFFSI